MDKQEFLKNFAEQFDETDPSTIQLDTKYKELGEWSSMVALVLIAMVDEKYDKKLVGADIKAADTVSDLFNIIQAK
jgi:acyl carrier protein